MNGWLRICQDCWQAQNPDEYCPPLTDYARCNWCGEDALTLGVRSVTFTVEPMSPVCDVHVPMPKEA